jgi:hypothetical protein
MTSKTRSFRPSPAMIVACLALLLALTGSAIAAGVTRNSVRSAQIADGTVHTVDLRDNAVNAPKIAPDAVGSEEIAENAVSSPEVAPDSLTAGDLGAASVTSSEVADQSLTADDLGPNSVGGSEIAPDSIRATQLGTVTQRNISATIQAGKTGSVSANCESGEQIVSGGGQPSVFGIEMTTTRPQGNAGSTRPRTTPAAIRRSPRSPSAWSSNHRHIRKRRNGRDIESRPFSLLQRRLSGSPTSRRRASSSAWSVP